MNTIKLTIAAFSFGLLLSSCASKAPTSTTSAEPMGDFVADYIKRHNIPGASLAVSYQGKIVYAKGFGFADIENKKAPQADTIFRIASVSKPITAVAILKVLEDSGKNIEEALDAPVFGKKGYLPQYKDIKDRRVYKITLRDLLQHTGGWNSDLGYDPQYDLYKIAKKMKVKAPANADAVIRYMLKYKKLDEAPGVKFHYSNFGYNLLGRIVEKLSGQPYEAYVQQKLFAPIGITDMRIAGNRMKDLLPNEARYYDDPRSTQVPSNYDGKTLGPRAYNEFDFYTMDAHGGWLGTPTDLVKFANAVTPGSGSVQLLKESTIQIMSAPNTKIGNDQSSLGWVAAENGKVISHAGALETGTLSYLTRRSDGVVWAVIFNRLPVKSVDDIGALATDLMGGMDSVIKKIEWTK